MLRRLVNALVDIVYPRTCVVCKKNLKDISCIDSLVCAECWGKIKINLPPFCYKCGKHMVEPVNNTCSNCREKQLYFDRAFSPCAYEGVIKELIHLFKYRNKDYLGKPLSRLMIEFIKEYNLPMDSVDFILPVPLHKTRLREREFNQAEILSNHIAKNFNKTVLNNVVRRHRYTQTQTELEKNLRLLNVQNSFSVAKVNIVKNKNLLLIDDVLTSGSTASEASRVLKNAGASSVFILTLAN